MSILVLLHTCKNDKIYYILDNDHGETSAKLPKFWALNEEDYKEAEKSWIDNCQPYESMFEPDQTAGNNPTSPNSLPPPPVYVPLLPDPALVAVLEAKTMIESTATPGMYVFCWQFFFYMYI